MICAETDEEAERLAASRAWRHAAPPGRLMAVPSVETALAFFEQTGPSRELPGPPLVVGSPGVVRAELEQIALEYLARES